MYTNVVLMVKRKVLLKLTSEKALSLSNTLYAPFFHRNIVSEALLNKVGLKLVFGVDKIINSHGWDFVGKRNICGGIFVSNIVQDIINNRSISNSAYIIESIKLWHDRLGHVKIASIKRLWKK